MNCSLNVSEKVTLWFQRKHSKIKRQLLVDNDKVKLASTNVFNITILSANDTGLYTCEACGKKNGPVRVIKIAGDAFAKAIITKQPNKVLYDLGERLKLFCKPNNKEKYKNRYDINWYKPDSKGTDIRQVSRGGVMLINSLSIEHEGIYKCKLERYLDGFVYHDAQSIDVKIKVPTKPEICINGSKKYYYQGSDISLSYNVLSYPLSTISWWRSSDGKSFQLITRCSWAKYCEKHEGSENITRTSFELENVKFPENNVTYKCNATNNFGNDSETFQVQVYVKPEVELRNQDTFEKGITLNCTLKKNAPVNPPSINYTWISCENEMCDGNGAKRPHQGYSLTLQNQPRVNMWYRCTAKNAAGKTTGIIKVINTENLFIKQDGGRRTSLFPNISQNIPVTSTSTDQNRTLFFIVVPTGLVSIIMLVVSFVVLYKRKKIYGGFYLFTYPPLPDYIKRLDKNGNIEVQIHKLPFIPEWEFPRERIRFVSELGSGQFGIVWLAEATGISAFRPRDILKEKENGRRFSFRNRMAKRNSYVYCKEVTKVAIKRIKDNSDQRNVMDLQCELKTLIHVGEHDNIVNVLGACTKGKSSNLWIILEYCPNGNLREFLRRSRNRYNAEEESLMPDHSQVIGPKNLIHHAWQIAKGMKFLISRKIIHRDLAARNILLGSGYEAKVGDFGLARDVYKYQEYLRKSSGMVPLKWMAVESIRDSIFTEKSDVWSFGVLLWELFTLGGTPYPGMGATEVYQTLLNEQRMEAPVHCPDEISAIMLKCWNADPEQRPKFDKLKKMLHELLDCEEITKLEEAKKNEEEAKMYLFDKSEQLQFNESFPMVENFA